MYKIYEMTEDLAEQISRWRYPAPYEIYDFGGDDSEVEDLMNGLHFTVKDEKNELCGFLALGWSAQIQSSVLGKIYEDERYTDFALGLKPELCGKGRGMEFLKACMEYIRELFPEDGLRLTVVAGNKRARKLYSRVGFKEMFSARVTVHYPGEDGKALSARKKVIIMTL